MAIAFTFGLILMWNPTTSAQSKYRMNIGIGVSTAMNGSYQFTMEHHFARKWSMIASAGLRFNSSHASEETIRHRSEFDTMPVLDTLSTPRHKESFGFSYWPQGTDKGIALSIGAEHISRDGFDAICGIAYSHLERTFSRLELQGTMHRACALQKKGYRISRSESILQFLI